MSDINEEKMQRVVEQMKEDNIKFIRLQFVDINGTVKNIVIPFNGDDMSELFNEGMLFDGSSIAGFVGINDSDLILKPDINTYSRLSWRPEESATCRFICDVWTAEGEPFAGDPRSVLKRSLANLAKRGLHSNTTSDLNLNFSLWTSMKTDIRCLTMMPVTLMWNHWTKALTSEEN